MRAYLGSRKESQMKPAAWAELWGGFVQFYATLTRNGNVLLPGTWRDRQGTWRSDVTFWEGERKINREFARDIAERLALSSRPNRGLEGGPRLESGQFPIARLERDERHRDIIWLELEHSGQMIQIRLKIFAHALPDETMEVGISWPKVMTLNAQWHRMCDENAEEIWVTEDITPDIRGAAIAMWAKLAHPGKKVVPSRHPKLWRACQTCAYKAYNHNLAGRGGATEDFGKLQNRWVCNLTGELIDGAEVRIAEELLDQRSQERRWMDEWRWVTGSGRRDTIRRILDGAPMAHVCKRHTGKSEASMERVVWDEDALAITCGSIPLETKGTMKFQIA